VGSETSIELEGNLFSNNTGAAGPGVCVSPDATLTSLGNNLLEDGSDSGIVDGVNGDIVGEAAMVSALADNGGFTPTHLPAPGSPAIDAISSGECSVDADQRGEERPAGAGGDIGSVEQ